MFQSLHEHIYILGPFCLTEQWRSVVSFRLGVSYVFDWHPNHKDFTIKTTGRCNYLLATDDSHMDTLEALTR